MTPYEERDAQLLAMVRREIDKVSATIRACNWVPDTQEWHAAAGELRGLHRILVLLDPNPRRPEMPPYVSRIADAGQGALK
jgi:hypothetical protein